MKFLIIDDDPDILEVVSMVFETRWPDATFLTAPEGTYGLDLYRKEGADLVILDLGLPDMDGLEVCRQIRAADDVPLVMLTARTEQKDIVRGLELGADDYITKPFNQMELLARVQAVLRRSGRYPNGHEKVFANGALRVNLSTREVWLRDRLVKLTPTEYNLLYYLVSNPGKPMTHRELLAKVWGLEYADATDYLKVHIMSLRRKLEDDPENPKFIATERGVGYKLIASPV